MQEPRSESYKYLLDEFMSIEQFPKGTMLYTVYLDRFCDKILNLMYNKVILPSEHEELLKIARPSHNVVSSHVVDSAMSVLGSYRKRLKNHYKLFDSSPKALRSTKEICDIMTNIYVMKGLTATYQEYVVEISKVYKEFTEKVVDPNEINGYDFYLYDRLVTLISSVATIHGAYNFYPLIDSLDMFKNSLVDKYYYVYEILYYLDVLNVYRDKFGYLENYDLYSPVCEGLLENLKNEINKCISTYGDVGFNPNVDFKDVFIKEFNAIIMVLKSGHNLAFSEVNKLLNEVPNSVYDRILVRVNNCIDFIVSRYTSIFSGFVSYKLYGEDWRMYLNIEDLKLNQEMVYFYSSILSESNIIEICLNRAIALTDAHEFTDDDYFDCILASSLHLFYEADLIKDLLGTFNKYSKNRKIETLDDFEETYTEEFAYMIKQSNMSRNYNKGILESGSSVIYLDKEVTEDILGRTDIFKDR